MDNSEIIVEKKFSNEEFSKEEFMQMSMRQNEKMAALGQLAGGIAHDFNNQLMSIIGNATMIIKSNDLSKIKEYAERIIHISEISADLTKKILMFSKREVSTNKRINLKNVIDNTMSMVESITKNIDINYSYGAQNKMIIGDVAQLESMLVNLLLNSRDAMMNSNGYINIFTEDTVVLSEMPLSHGEILPIGEYIKITIEDNGSGINQEIMQKIFEPYFTTKIKSKGTGLGLSVVFGTVKTHSGFINVISKVNIGTRFEMFFPVSTTVINDQTIYYNKPQSGLIMLVDDDINALNIEAELLEDLGYDVIKYDNPLKALKHYSENREKIAFCVIDMSMPHMSGKELYFEIKKINKNAIIIFITGYANQKDFDEIKKENLIIIEKPFSIEKLSNSVAKIYS